MFENKMEAAAAMLISKRTFKKLMIEGGNL